MRGLQVAGDWAGLAQHELRPTPSTAQYIPRVFGFKVHKAPEAQAAPLAREEWPKRPKNEPVSDWDS